LLDVLNGHPSRCHQVFGMTAEVFQRLRSTLMLGGVLHHTRYVTAEEHLAIFLFTVRTGNGYREVAEKFQHSVDTISQ
jgi:hypothetical protein